MLKRNGAFEFIRLEANDNTCLNVKRLLYGFEISHKTWETDNVKFLYYLITII